MHFSRSIVQYRSRGRFYREIGSFSRRLFSHLCSSKSKKIHYFVIWHDFSNLQWLRISSFHLVFLSLSVSDPQQGHEYSRFFGLYVDVFQMWTSRQQIEVLNIVHVKKYPEVPIFWRLFYRAKTAEISYLLLHFSAMGDNICYMCKAYWRLFASIG